MFSVIFLLEDKYNDFSNFVGKLDRIFHKLGRPYEILIIANGTGNFFRSQRLFLHGLSRSVRAFEFANRTTQAVCLRAILNEARGDTMAIFGSYQQITDESILKIIDSLDDSVDVISPWRCKRVDPFFNQLQSIIFNWLVGRFVKTDLHDFSCTVKVCRRSVLEETDVYGNMFRFLPVLATEKGFRIKEVPAVHFQERGETGFYNFSDYISRLIDIFTLFFNTRFIRKPLRFFSAIGFGFLIVGILSILYMFFQRFFFDIPIGNRPLLFLALLVTIVGVLVASAGLLGEIISFSNGRHKKEYTVEKVI
ncbi:MAG: hypothetical protein JSW07_17910 [bacterium]|nr:MAG: hypothetical protein JSW07_17910 [bacterium]